MSKPRIVILTAHGGKSFSKAQRVRIRRAGNIVFIKAPRILSQRDFLARLSGAEIAGITPRATPNLSNGLLDSLPGLKGVAIPTTGIEWLDTKAFHRRGILLSHVPGFSSPSVAEFTWGLVIALARRIYEAEKVLSFTKDSPLVFPGTEIEGKTLGIIGLGDIGRRVARVGSAFGMKVLAHDPDFKKCLHAKKASLPDLIRSSDVISLHLPLNEGTRNIMSYRSFKLFKRGGLLINTARPDLVSRPAVLKALRTGRLGGYAFDIGYSTRTIEKDLISHPRVLAMPHISWYTREASSRELDLWVDNIVALANKKPKNLIGD